ncbi:type III-B CRISPR module RAMP protein Cmr4 [Thermococcus chitonophagus]|nr:type III-B CRISPR module RAMP protein Cmr4 [Thermococcus chitonophagus]CUX77818.1 CRISPR-associated RAMP Cmr4 [Thermococcus chitonophagus]
MNETFLFFGFYGLTPIHAGSGAELSVVDLPIQRERHTGFPTIWGQSLKGVLRSEFRRKELLGELNSECGDWKTSAEKYILGMSDKESGSMDEAQRKNLERYKEDVEKNSRDPPLTEIIFGPATTAASEHAGAVSVGDARVLLFPVRSLKGVFAYVTCPMVLRRLVEDLKFATREDDSELQALEKIVRDIESSFEMSVNSQSDDKIPAFILGSELRLPENVAVLEDIELHNVNTEIKIDFETLFDQLKGLFPGLLTEEDLRKRLAIVPDEIFRNFVLLTTEIVARIRINAKTGTVEKGGLWYEEFLPADTVMYSLVAVNNPKVKKNELPDCLNGDNPAGKIAKILQTTFNSAFLQIGGDETVGKGFVKVSVAFPEVSIDEHENP